LLRLVKNLLILLNRLNRKTVIPIPRNRERKLSNISTSFFLFVFLSVHTPISAQESIHDILNFNDCPGIDLVDNPELYVGDDLFNLINGGAELYHEYGFVEVLAADLLISGDNPVKVEIYDMGSPEAAWGIYSMTATSAAKIFNAGSDGRQGLGFAQFVKGNHMVYMYYDEIAESEILDIASCIAKNIEHESPRPDIMSIVGEGRKGPEKLVYFEGNLGLSGIYSFHYKDVFAYEEGAAAIYPDMKAFLLRYANEGECIDKYNAAREFFMNSSKYHDQITLRGSFHMKDRKEQQIDCYYETSFLIIFISSGEQDLNDIRETINQNMLFPVSDDR